MKIAQPATRNVIRAGLIVGAGWLLSCSIDGFFRHKAMLPQATDPTDGIGYRMFGYVGLAVLSAGTLLGTVSSLFLSGGRTNSSDPKSF